MGGNCADPKRNYFAMKHKQRCNLTRLQLCCKQLTAAVFIVSRTQLAQVVHMSVRRVTSTPSVTLCQ
jgi:hypothetical protein